MDTLLILAGAIGVAALLHRKRRKRTRTGFVARRSHALLGVIAILALQTVLGAPRAFAQGEQCAAPAPERPGSGLVGAIDPPHGQGLKGSAYLKYGYAGMVWYVYDSGCIGTDSGGGISLPDPGTTIDTWLGNQLFNIAKNIVGATNSLHYTVMEGGLLSPLYDAIKEGAKHVYNSIYAQLFGIAALLLALLMFRHIWRGDLAMVSKRGLYALGGVWLAASSLALLNYYDEIDNAIVQTTTNIQAGFVDTSQSQVVRHVLPTKLHTEVVYENWLRGEFGSPDAPKAQKWGEKLLRAQAFSWSQIRSGADAEAAVVDKKNQLYKKVSENLGTATGYFTGEKGSRIGTGFLALGQSLVYALFQLFAKAAVLLAQVLVRLFTLAAPLLGLIAIVHHDILRKVARVVGGVAFNLIVLSVLAGIHVLLLQAIFAAGDSLSILTQMVMAGLITVLLFLVGKPTRRLWQMVEMSVGAMNSAVPSPRGGLLSRLRKNSGEPSPQDEFWRSMRGGSDSSGGGSGGRPRPEATVQASAERLDAERPGTHPSSAWPGGAAGGTGAPRPAAVESGAARALPAAAGQQATPSVAAAPGQSTSPVEAGAGGGAAAARAVGAPSRTADTAPMTDRRWDHGDEPDPVVVPSRVDGVPGQRAPSGEQQPHRSPPESAQGSSGPVPAESEMVAGKPVFVLYRPSQGLEVRQDMRETDRAMR